MKSSKDEENSIVQKVLNTAGRYNLFRRGSRILVGISGGPDSVCLLHVLCCIAGDFDLYLSALHVNHMLRGEDAYLDEEYVKSFCNELKVPLYIEHADAKGYSRKTGISLEEAGREIRYRLYEKYAEKTDADAIALAHNMNDQAETVLLNLIRGTGLDGLTGMEYKRGKIIRPLLNIRREEIENYCRVNNLQPRTDSSNKEDIFTRNRIRLKLIPFIDENFNTDLVYRLSRMTEILKDDRNCLEISADSFFNSPAIKRSKDVVEIEISKLMDLHGALRARVIRKCIGFVKGNVKNISQQHMEDVIKLAAIGKTGTMAHLPGGIRAEISYGILKLYKKSYNEENSQYCYLINIPGEIYIKEIDKTLKADLIENPSIDKLKGNNENKINVQLFDYEKLRGEITVRNRRNGDVFRPVNSPGTKKLKEYFIDKKVPRWERDKFVLVAKGSEIAWIVGHKISDKFKITENTKIILKLEFV